MANPIESTKFIHKAIRSRAEAIAAAAQALNRASGEAELAGLGELVAYLQRVEQYHSAAEEQIIFPALEQRSGQSVEAYLLDHTAGKRLMANLAEALSRWQAAKAEPKDELLAMMKNSSTCLAYHQSLHIEKEESLIIPLLVEHFEPAEQARMVKDSMALIPDDFKPSLVPWIFRALTPDEQEAYLKGMLKTMPEASHGAIIGWLQEGLTAEDWSQLVSRVPRIPV